MMSHLIKELKKVSDPSPYRIWYNDWVKQNAKDNVLDVGKSVYWDYGFPTLDNNNTLKPTFVGNIEKTNFPEKYFDLVLCNGMYECVDNPQAMIDEVLRIGKKAIFGFVGKDYKPYKDNWKFYDNEAIPFTKETKNFNNEYHFIICEPTL